MGTTSSQQYPTDIKPLEKEKVLIKTKKDYYDIENPYDCKEIKFISLYYCNMDLLIDEKKKFFDTPNDLNEYLIFTYNIDLTSDVYDIIYESTGSYCIYNKLTGKILLSINTNASKYIHSGTDYEKLKYKHSNSRRILFHLYMCDNFNIKQKDDFIPVIKSSLPVIKIKETYDELMRDYEILRTKYEEHLSKFCQHMKKEDIDIINSIYVSYKLENPYY